MKFGIHLSKSNPEDGSITEKENMNIKKICQDITNYADQYSGIESCEIYDIVSMRKAIVMELQSTASAYDSKGAYEESEKIRRKAYEMIFVPDEAVISYAVRNGIDVESYRR